MLKRNQSLGLNRHPSTAPKPPAFLVKIPLFDRLSAWSGPSLSLPPYSVRAHSLPVGLFSRQSKLLPTTSPRFHHHSARLLCNLLRFQRGASHRICRLSLHGRIGHDRHRLEFRLVGRLYFVAASHPIRELWFPLISNALSISTSTLVSLLPFDIPTAYDVPGVNIICLDIDHHHSAVGSFTPPIQVSWHHHRPPVSPNTQLTLVLASPIYRQFFKRKFEYMVTHSADARSRVNKLSTSSSHRFPSVFTESVDDVTSTPPTTNHHSRNSSSTMIKEKKGKKPKLRADMVRRVDVPVRVNQMNVGGWLREVEENNSGVGNGVGGRGGAAIGEHGDNENALDDDEEGLEIGNGHQGRLVEEPDELASKDTRSPSVDRGERLDDREKEVVREVTRGFGFPQTFSLSRQVEIYLTLFYPSRTRIQIDDSTKPDRGLSLRRGLDPNGFAPPEHGTYPAFFSKLETPTKTN